ncbi:unnamed protein product [Cylindrotheca closterium]|uniref:Uncharacterized protein n=1 Tax=Cylindrotheca closterium TaxID=2856 RepID=A0AAD2CWS8_9STRA|nr:unnamed protein product [Cylindrotheca closterium]
MMRASPSSRRRPRIASPLFLVLICGAGGHVQALDWKKSLAEGKSFSLPKNLLSGINFDIVKKNETNAYQMIASRVWGTMKGLQGSDGTFNAADSSSSSSSVEYYSSNVSSDVALIGSLLSWLYASWIALMTPHPNPAVAATLPLRHDILTFSQAVAFQVPIMVAAFTALEQNNGNDLTLHRRLLLGIGTMSLWTGAGVFYGKTFSRGYELFSTGFRYTIATIEIAIAFWCFSRWAESVVVPLDKKKKFLISRLLRGSVGSVMSLLHGSSDSGDNYIVIAHKKPSMDNPEDIDTNDIALYTASTIGLLALSILPQLTSFPTATIPTILGKRFSRAASGITFLAAVMAYSLRDYYLKARSNGTRNNHNEHLLPLPIQTLRKGLAIGAIGHLCLVVGKFVGIDGGGLLMEGNGLWEFYPSMVNAARAATTLMFVTFWITAFVCTRR